MVTKIDGVDVKQYQLDNHYLGQNAAKYEIYTGNFVERYENISENLSVYQTLMKSQF